MLKILKTTTVLLAALLGAAPTYVSAQEMQPERVAEPPTRVRPQAEARKSSSELLESHGRYRAPELQLPQLPAKDEGGGDEIPDCHQAGIQTQLCDRVVSRYISPGGDVEVHCANGATWTTITKWHEIYTAPDGRRCSLPMAIPATHLPRAEPPTSDSEWAGQVNAWLDDVAMRLLQRIQALVGAGGLENYKFLENERAAGLYQRVEMRLDYLDRLMEHL